MNVRTRGARHRRSHARTHRRTVRGAARFAATWVTIAILAGCASIASGDASERDAAAASDGTENAEERQPLFQTSEDYWVETPWFSVSSIIIRVRTTQTRTVIVLPESSIMRDYMMNDRNVVFDADAVPHRMRFLLGLGLKTGDVDPFFDSDRIESPE